MSAHDAAYLALAEALGAPQLTSDVRLGDVPEGSRKPRSGSGFRISSRANAALVLGALFGSIQALLAG